MRSILHPARAVAIGFLLAILLGTVLLSLPAARVEGQPHSLVVAAFTSVSAICVTGLVVVDTGTHWSPFGQAVIMMLFQLGGFGMMTAATLLGLLVNRSPRLRTRLVTQVETKSLALGDVRSIAKLVLGVTLAVEFLIAVVLMARFASGYDRSWGEAAWDGVFHAISAFNNAGFSLHPDSMMRYAADGMILGPIMIGVIVGGIGFPVLHDLRLKLRDPRHWSLHTKLTLSGTALLLLLGFLAFLLFEWANARTLGPMSIPQKILSAAFASVSTRSGGFNSVDIGALAEETWAAHYLLMFIGGGSGGTAGGVKVATVAILLLLVIAEIRGHPDSEAFGRRVGAPAHRQAITLLVLSSATVVSGTLALLYITDFPTDQVIFEVISAFATVGLSTGITPHLPESGQWTLILLMYFGRIGIITFATSLVLGERRMPYRYPEEHPIVG